MKKLYTGLFFVLTLLPSLNAELFAQRSSLYPLEARHWYFGEKGAMRFRDTVNADPIPLRDASPLLNAMEGSSAISDTAGNLLMYCATRIGNNDFSTVWNRNHQIMPNGDSIEGGSSSTQNAIIVRKPGSFKEYYIFSVAQLENYGGFGGGGNGFYYTKVHMDSAGGLGDVVPSEKNVLIMDTIAEKISAVLHRNKRDVWVVSHRLYTDEWVAVLVTPNGPQRPVISRAGVPHFQESGTPTPTTIAQYARGALKISPSGNRIACAISSAYLDWPGGTRNIVQLGQFNNQNGSVFDVIHLLNPVGNTTAGFGPYGLEFSANNAFLYVGYRNRDEIVRWDLCRGVDSAAIANSREVMTGWTGAEPGCLQLGLDQRIYISKALSFGPVSRTIGRIGNAGERTGVQVNMNAVTLPDSSSADRGLTNTNQSFFNNLDARLEFSRLCERDTVQFRGQAQCQGTVARYYWNFGDNPSFPPGTYVDSTQRPGHRYANPGRYRVILRVLEGNLEDTISEVVTITPLATGVVDYEPLACKSTYRYVFLKDTSVNRFDATSYRWAYEGNMRGQNDTLLGGRGLREISVTWDTNQVSRFKLVVNTTTTLNENCPSDTIRFEVFVNQRRGLMPTGPDTICHDPQVAVVFKSADRPRNKFPWIYTPSSDPNVVNGQFGDSIRLLIPNPGNKSIRVGPFIDTLAGICYVESSRRNFFVAAAPSDSITISGTQAICADPELTYGATNFVGSSIIKWGFRGPNPISEILTQSNDSAKYRFNVGAMQLGRGLYYVTGQEISRDGCPGPVQSYEVYNDCLPFPNLVTGNTDQSNDFFKVPNIERYSDNSLEVVNRWGRSVYKATGYKNEGFPKLEQGMYFYLFKVNGYQGRTIEQKGWFDVTR